MALALSLDPDPESIEKCVECRHNFGLSHSVDWCSRNYSRIREGET